MKRRKVKKKWNREIKEFKKDLKRSEYSIERTFLSYEYYEGEFTWSDIYFIGTYNGSPRLFNCTIMSAVDEFESKVDKIVDKKMEEIYGDNYWENKSFDWSEPEGEGKFKLRRIDFITKDEELEKRMKAKKQDLIKEVIESGEVKTRSYVKALPNFHYGVGLDLVTEEKMLNKQTVLEYVKKIQQLNVTGFDKIYLSDKEISNFTLDDHSSAKSHSSRALGI
jgi:hypothetical protein